MAITGTEGSGTRDQHGNPMSATREAAERYDAALDRLLRFDTATLDRVGGLAEHDADVPMTHVLTAYLSLTSTDPADLGGVRDALATLERLDVNEREAMHASAIAAWAGGDWARASRLLDDLLLRWPADLLALMIGHQLDFFLGDNLNLRDRPCRSLPAIDATHPHAALVRGMQAFGLEEAGSYQQAEESGLAALAVNADDVWAVHAVTHVLEMQGRVDDGIRFLTDRVADWGTGNLFTVHNWWHLGLFCLEAGRPDVALRVYDREIHHAGSTGVPIEMLDASALLWRLRIDGVDTADRFATLADSWQRVVVDDPWYVFNDVHAVMALVGAGRLVEARRVVERVGTYLARASGTNAMMAAEIGLPACHALLAHGEGRWADVVAELAPIRRTLHRFGGSHAQRDALQRTLLDAAFRIGDTARAQVLLNERLTLRPTSVFGWDRLARLRRSLGDEQRAIEAEASAARHRSRFAAVLPAGV